MQITIEAGRVSAMPETTQELKTILAMSDVKPSGSGITAIVSEGALICPKCKDGREFRSPIGLNVHMSRMHR